jgi:hypothetical protein
MPTGPVTTGQPEQLAACSARLRNQRGILDAYEERAVEALRPMWSDAYAVEFEPGPWAARRDNGSPITGSIPDDRTS